MFGSRCSWIRPAIGASRAPEDGALRLAREEALAIKGPTVVTRKRQVKGPENGDQGRNEGDQPLLRCLIAGAVDASGVLFGCQK